MVYQIAGFGHRPGGLGNHWHPHKWMPAIDHLREMLSVMCEDRGELRVVTSARPGFDMMLAVGALLARDESFPVELTVVAPFPGWGEAKDFGSRQIERWYHRVLARPDVEVIATLDRPPLDAKTWRAVEYEQRRAVLVGADLALTCWNGSRKSQTAVDVARASAKGVDVLNVYREVAAALGLPPVLREAGEGHRVG